MGDAGGHRRPPAVHPRGPRGSGLPRHLSGRAAVPARALPDDVHDPAVDDPPVRRVLHRGGVQRLLPAQPRRRAEGAVDRVRSAHPPRLRLRPPAGARRRRHGRGGDRLDPRHAAALRRHPAGPDDRLDDHERRRAAGDGALHPRGRGAGRGARAAGRDHPERHPQGVHGPQHLHLPAEALDADRQRHLRLHLAEDAAVQLDLHLRLPHPGGRGDRRPGAGLHAGRRRGVRDGGQGRRAGRRRVRAAPVVLLGHRHELLHGGREAPGRAAAVGEADAGGRRAEPEVAVAAHPLADLGLVADRAGRLQQRRPHLPGGDGRDPGAHPVAAHQRPRRGARAAHRLLRADRPQHPAGAAAGVGHDAGDRPVGRLGVRREAHLRPGPRPPGRTSRRSPSTAAWPRPSTTASRSCASRRPPPAPRRASTPAGSR